MLDEIEQKLLALKNQPMGHIAGLTETEIQFLCKNVSDIFMEQPCLLELKAPLTIVGDIHGQYQDLLRVFDSTGYPPNSNYLFLGDYVDRGQNSIENVCLLFCYKIKYPNTFYMLRGNHECSYINRLYGFYDECIQNYSTDIWRLFCDVFNRLPIAAIIEEKIFCVHGGLSPSLNSLDEIKNIERPIEVPEEGLLCDLLWSDPNMDVDDWEDNERGTSYCFGAQQVEDFLTKFGFDLVCRAHQAIMEGYEFPFPDRQSIVTVFSAPNYCNEYMNKGAILSVSDQLFCSFTILNPMKYESDFNLQPRPGTPPRATTGEQESEFTVATNE
ncbi:Serine/threonine protein phosphatase PP1-gamma catalytic subunit, putative [Trichomonas vaginalis G3]|uniref:Serine/threonine-protein phosphatase n=2 Tax=Trichomonas vaginalis TaxID=5722 RepID=A0A8U0WP89_TRIV3|nr:serine/threonine protein phosphatase type 1 catalytic subunit [Trichomonas vaginalis G3]AAW71398.1 serine/threonine protein phosphatase type 1 catalytic subunit [Trichomonas vaginalis]ACN39603.1 serine/threonine protein phosphatase type 1 catalytic subunit [Trichomonas vaginalis]EAY11363.1 Serine/threonine protein phosphatase PP1-gamma catalytic subunit, putative [Trichomonas vaginalis G3]KAI5530528.1 serine/threonine protein phosphatase type 1 catalytic subunit [Trichomonas vaginalis G3]|eukprot:XP_001323586.1 Serine/threonine protein phosphatase PP1-gamma catalytic subunit [Trichomonas vaginalis G3]